MALGSSDSTLKIIIKARDDASKTLRKFKKNLNSMKPAFKKMSLIGTAAFAAVGAAAWKTIKAFQAQERSVKRLEQLTRQTTGATDAQIQALKDQAVALQKVGVVGDEIIMFGQSQLATFALQTEAIALLTPGILDLAVATKGVNATQEDMINIGNLVGKVMAGQVGALSRLGITFSDAQEEILKTGDEMERAATLADVLAGNFGGLNEATRLTSEGGVKALQNSMGDLMENIGAVLVPLLAQVVEKLTPVVDSIMKWVKANPKFTKVIILGTLALTALVAILGFVGLAMAAISIPALIVVGVIAALVAIGILLIKNWDRIRNNAIWVGEVVTSTFTNMRDTITALIDVIKMSFNSWITNLKTSVTKIRTFWANVKSIFKEGINFLIGLAEGWANLYVKAINTIINALNKIQISVPKWVPKIGGRSWGINIPTAAEVTLPRFEHGGRVPGPPGVPVPILAHGQEQIIPVNRAGRIAGGNTFIININNPSIRSHQDIAAMKDIVERALRSVVREHKLTTI